MKLLLAGFISVLATAAFAQPDNKPANAMDLRSAQADLQRSDGVPAGGCMPIGLTARGDLVFSMQCREMIEREHRPVPEQQLHVPLQSSRQEQPKATTAEKDVAATGQTPASLIPIGQAASDQTQTGQLQAGEFLTGQTQKRAPDRATSPGPS